MALGKGVSNPRPVAIQASKTDLYKSGGIDCKVGANSLDGKAGKESDRNECGEHYDNVRGGMRGAGSSRTDGESLKWTGGGEQGKSEEATGRWRIVSKPNTAKHKHMVPLPSSAKTLVANG